MAREIICTDHTEICLFILEEKRGFGEKDVGQAQNLDELRRSFSLGSHFCFLLRTSVQEFHIIKHFFLKEMFKILSPL